MQVPSFSIHDELPMPHQFETVPKAMIVDLRGNHGGDLDTLSEFTGHFVSEPGTMGEIVTRKKTEPVKLKPKKPNFATIPLFVLVDSESASAAEMFARHLQLGLQAKVVGDRRLGKVVGSRYFPERVGTDRVIPFGIQISVGKAVFPNNEVLENAGVTPDVVCLPKGEDLARNADPCLEQAVSLARKAADMTEMVPELCKRQIAEMLQSRESEKAWKH
jgi:C-terminal processing protease CtpA/Prc